MGRIAPDFLRRMRRHNHIRRMTRHTINVTAGILFDSATPSIHDYLDSNKPLCLGPLILLTDQITSLAIRRVLNIIPTYVRQVSPESVSMDMLINFSLLEGVKGDLNSAFTAHVSLSTSAERDARVPSAPPMFREINNFKGDRNTFDNLVGDRYNYGSKNGKNFILYNCVAYAEPHRQARSAHLRHHIRSHLWWSPKLLKPPLLQTPNRPGPRPPLPQ